MIRDGARRFNSKEASAARLRSRPAKDGGDFDMGRKAELVKRRHRLDLKAAIDENACSARQRSSA
jgi:hypothetical protein